jgi:hypothetical protein
VEVVLPDGTRDRFDATYEIPLVEAARGGDVLEVALRRSDVVGLPFRVAWAAGGEAGDVRLDHVETLEVALPEGALSVTLRNETSDAALFAIGAWRLREPGSWWVSMLLAGIALGVTAGVLAPIAVLVSRFTSAPTAVAAALVLALTGLARPWLVGLLPPGADLKQGLALRTVEGAARLAPDVAGIRLLGEPGVGRALEWTGLGVVLPTIAYALVALLLVALPAPRGLEPEPSP